MKKILVFCLFLWSVSSLAQNIEDPYIDHEYDNWWPHEKIEYYEGEYQILLDNFFWAADSDYENTVISLSIEVVSFPFIPSNFNGDSNDTLNKASQDRELNTEITKDQYEYGSITQSTGNNGATGHEGIGWEIGDYYIYQKVFNTNECKYSVGMSCRGDYLLISGAFHESYIADHQVLLPHTVLKHSLYFHCGSTINSPVVDTISWIYDNTRGEMRTYPFEGPTASSKDPGQELENSILDVCFRPTFKHYPIKIPYVNAWGPNPEYYKGLPDGLGSLNYYPPGEVLSYYNACGNYPVYYDMESPDPVEGLFYSFHATPGNAFYTSDYVHPPPYALLDVPLLNANANYYAGYDYSGKRIDSPEQSYYIENSFDLSIINPTEKIIYNPYKVTIEEDLTFPCRYKFLTLHGKYPDYSELHHTGDYSKHYWDEIPYFTFTYDKDYPVPVHDVQNNEDMSTYILDGATITIEPYVIIMDAEFKGFDNAGGKGRIRYDPDYTFGNWTYDSETIVIEIIDWDTYPIIDCQVYDGIGSKEELINEINEPVPDNLLRILNSGTEYVQIQVNSSQSSSSYIQVFDSFGKMVFEKSINGKDRVIDCSGFQRGIYHTTLVINGEIAETQSFTKM